MAFDKTTGSRASSPKEEMFRKVGEGTKRLRALQADVQRTVAARGRGRRVSLKETLMGFGGMAMGLTAGPETVGYTNAVLERAQGGKPLDPIAYPPTFGGAFRTPKGGLSKYPPKELPSAIPGFKLRRAAEGDPILSWTGRPKIFHKPTTFGLPPRKRSQGLAYNLEDQHGMIRGSINMERDNIDGKVHVNEVYIDPDVKDHRAFIDLGQMALGHELPMQADIVNPKLAKLAERLAKRDPEKFGYLMDMGNFLRPNEQRAYTERGRLRSHPNSNPLAMNPPPRTRVHHSGVYYEDQVIPARVDQLGNGLTRVTQRDSGLVQTFDRNGRHHSGPRLYESIEEARRGTVEIRRELNRTRDPFFDQLNAEQFLERHPELRYTHGNRSEQDQLDDLEILDENPYADENPFETRHSDGDIANALAPLFGQGPPDDPTDTADELLAALQALDELQARRNPTSTPFPFGRDRTERRRSGR
jgi:hypothetical protein